MLTPRFEVCAAQLRRNLASFQGAFPQAAIHYAIKANAEPVVLSTLAEAGASFEVASFGELRMLLAAAPSVTPDRVIFGTAIKSAADIEGAAAWGIRRFAFDCAEELPKLARCAPGAEIYLRLKVPDTDSAFCMSEKFGAPAAQAVDLLTEAASAGLEPIGVSFNVGSQARRVDAWAQSIQEVAPILWQLDSQGLQLPLLNLGGGYPQRYVGDEAPPLTEIAAHVTSALDELPYRPSLLLEPGRGLVASAVTLLTTVVGRAERAGKPWLYLDAGVYNALFEALACQGRTRYPVSVERSHQSLDELRPCVLAGPTGDGLDVIDREVWLPAHLQEGDVLRLHNVGAYGSGLASAFNGFALATTQLHGDDAACEHCLSLPRQHASTEHEEALTG